MKTDNVKSEIVWKGFRLGNLFEESAEHYLEKSKKNYNINDVKTDDYPIAVCSASKYNNGIVGYIAETDDVSIKKRKGYITKGGFGHFFYQDDWFIKPGGSWGMLNIIKFKDDKLKTMCDLNIDIYYFLCRILTNIFEPMCSFGYAVPFDRELILLPCLEVSENDEYIWEENGRYYTLAVEYIKELMEKAKERKEARTIRMYEAERAKYEAERAKYEAGYNAEKPNVLWKGFRLGNLFESINGRDSNIAQKNLHKSSVKTDEFSVAIVTESKLNNGVGFYLKNDDPIVKNKMQRGLTFGTQFGNCNFHNYDYFIIGNLNYLNFKNDYLYSLCNDFVGNYFAKLISHIFQKSNLFGYGNKIDQAAFSREIILLPCLEISENDEYIWEENGRYYTLATNYISYLYLTGKMNKYQKLIDTYTYTY